MGRNDRGRTFRIFQDFDQEGKKKKIHHARKVWGREMQCLRIIQDREVWPPREGAGRVRPRAQPS